MPVSLVNSFEELANDPQIKHRQMILDVDTPDKDTIRQTGISINLSETPGSIRNLGSVPGVNTSEILTELGYNRDEIKSLREEGAIGIVE